MKDFEKIFEDMSKIFEDTDRAFKKVDFDMDKVFKDMDKVFKQAEKMMSGVYRKQTVAPWKPWFAWRPVKLKGRRVWFKKIYRRKINTYVDHDDWARYEYGDMFDVLKEAGN